MHSSRDYINNLENKESLLQKSLLPWVLPQAQLRSWKQFEEYTKRTEEMERSSDFRYLLKSNLNFATEPIGELAN